MELSSEGTRSAETACALLKRCSRSFWCGWCIAQPWYLGRNKSTSGRDSGVTAVVTKALSSESFLRCTCKPASADSANVVMVLKNHHWEAGYQQAEPPSADRANQLIRLQECIMTCGRIGRRRRGRQQPCMNRVGMAVFRQPGEIAIESKSGLSRTGNGRSRTGATEAKWLGWRRSDRLHSRLDARRRWKWACAWR
jgi:hypothetical protein